MIASLLVLEVIVRIRIFHLIVFTILFGACSSSSEYKSKDLSAINSQEKQKNQNKAEDDKSIEDLGKEEKDNDSPILGFEKGVLPDQWIHGASNCEQDSNPSIQVHEYNPNFYILRQNKCINFEAPFIYLILGDSKALLLDSGATQNANLFPIQKTVESLMVDRYGDQRTNISLVVAHSHGHGDHIAGDLQFQDQPNTEVVGTSQQAVASFFGIADWPNQIVRFDLGNRILEVIPIPGHHDAHIAIYDPRTQILLSGDSLYPGRLYVAQWETYRTSIKRLTDYAASKSVIYVLGAHIEMTNTPGQDYPIGLTFQPAEHVLELRFSTLQLLNSELDNIGATPMRKVTDSFIITPN